MSSQAVLMRVLVILGIVILAVLAGCGGGANQPSPPNPTPPNPTPTNPPTISSISPNSTVAGSGGFTLTINGANFIAASVVNFGSATPATTFVNSTQLTAAIPAASVPSAGTVAVTVTNPAPSGSTSKAVNFIITGGTNPVPSVSSLLPSCAPVGVQGFNVRVSGSNFVASSVVRLNGRDQPTTFNDSSDLTAQISASDIAAVGTHAVTVFNPAPGGGSSNSSTFTISGGEVSPQSIALDPIGKFAYVANEGNAGCPVSFISTYTIDATGTLTSIAPEAVFLYATAHFVTVDPFGRFAYVAHGGDGPDGEVPGGFVSAYSINPTSGALTLKRPLTISGLHFPWSVAVDPSGKFAYVGNTKGTNVSMFTINGTTGVLTSIGAIASGGSAHSVTVHPTGKFAYVANWSGPPGSAGNVSMYAINATTGTLALLGTIATGTDPVSVAVDPKGQFAYVTNFDSTNVSMYSIKDTTGALTSIGLITAGTGPFSVAVDPKANFVYVANSGSNDVSMYTIDSSGALSLIGTTPAGSSPSSIAIHPSGNFAYVTNSVSNDISMYSIDGRTGALRLIGTTGK